VVEIAQQMPLEQMSFDEGRSLTSSPSGVIPASHQSLYLYYGVGGVSNKKESVSNKFNYTFIYIHSIKLDICFQIIPIYMTIL
jgi:hypothetical protein